MKKTVNIKEEHNKVYLLVVWNFASRQARKNEYEKNYLDQLRFKNRIKICENVLCKILNITHRTRIYCERFNKN